MIQMLALIPDWHFMIWFAVFGAVVGGLVVHLVYSWSRMGDQEYIKGLKEDRECRDNYIHNVLGRDADLPYCEDDDL